MFIFFFDRTVPDNFDAIAPVSDTTFYACLIKILIRTITQHEYIHSDIPGILQARQQPHSLTETDIQKQTINNLLLLSLLHHGSFKDEQFLINTDIAFKSGLELLEWAKTHGPINDVLLAQFNQPVLDIILEFHLLEVKVAKALLAGNDFLFQNELDDLIAEIPPLALTR